MVYLEMSLRKYFMVTMVDILVMFTTMSMLLMYGYPSKYGFVRPKQGFFTIKFYRENFRHRCRNCTKDSQWQDSGIFYCPSILYSSLLIWLGDFSMIRHIYKYFMLLVTFLFLNCFVVYMYKYYFIYNFILLIKHVIFI